jgi:hypothetical protein
MSAGEFCSGLVPLHPTEIRMRASSIAKVLVCLVFVLSAAGRLGAQAAPANETATQFYTRYLAAFQKATKMEQVLPFMSAARVTEYNGMPAEQKGGMLELIKMMAATNVKVTKEAAAGTGATLTVTGVDSMEKKPQYGTVTLVKEAGAWKIAEESWTNVKP